MNLNPEDPRLTAYLLGELPADEAAAVERAVAADPALGLVVREMDEVQRMLTDTLAPESASLMPRQRDAVLSAARHADQSGKIVSLRSQRWQVKSLLIPLTAAALIALAVFIMVRLPAGKSTVAGTPESPDESGDMPMQIALLPAPGPLDASGKPSEARPTASSSLAKAAESRAAALQSEGDLFLRNIAERLAESPPPAAGDLPKLEQRGAVPAASRATLELPVHSGRSSLAWITHSIRTDRKLPPSDAVRLEEVLNNFALRPAGAAAISQGVTLSTESVACPWKPSATLVVVSFRGASDTARDVTATFHADPATVRNYRLLGFAPVSGLAPGPLPTRLPAKAITSLVIEIEPLSPEGNLGSVEWTVNNQAAPAIAISRQGDAEPSDDARFAILVSTFCQWLVGEPAGLVDADLVAAIARENASDTMAADRADFLNLVDQSLNR